HLLRHALGRVRPQRDEPVPGLRAERLDRVARAARELDLDRGLLYPGLRRELLDPPVNAVDQVVQRPGEARNPELRHQNRLSTRAAWPSATCASPSSVTTRPRGVRWMKPSWSRYGSQTSPIVSRSSPTDTPREGEPTAPPA